MSELTDFPKRFRDTPIDESICFARDVWIIKAKAHITSLIAVCEALEAENAALKAERVTPNAESVDTMKKYLDTVNEGWEYDMSGIEQISLNSQREGNGD